MPNLKGIILSTKMNSTVVVAVPCTVRHLKYGKVMKKTTRLSAHNEIDGLAVGDAVEVVGCRPYSRTVFFKVTKVIASKKKKS